MLSEQSPPQSKPADPVADAIAWHNGDAVAAVATLIEDCRFLRQQLALAEGLMSCGMSRGWRPRYERGE
nr:hypothetical protein [Rhizobium daejeonense]